MTNDYETIRQLSYEYTYRLDLGDFAGLGNLLRNGRLGVTWFGVQGPWAVGEKEIEAFYRTEVSTYDETGNLVPAELQGNPLTHHVISNHAIYLDGEKATGKSYYSVYQRPPGLPYQIILAGRYEDRFEKIEGVWRFTEKHLIAEYLNNVEYHARQYIRVPD